jgi:4-carboxymuconolactone decarboxylase
VKLREGDGVTTKDFDVGLKVRKAVLGPAYVAKALQGADDFSQPFQTLLTEVCWGRVWGRPGLSRRQRSLNTLCMLAALNRSQEFETHVRGALRNGCTRKELRETFLQIAIYCGMPAGVEAFRVARRVFAEDAEVPVKGKAKRPKGSPPSARRRGGRGSRGVP